MRKIINTYDMDGILTKNQRLDLEKLIDSRWDEVLKMKGLKASIFVPRGVGDRGKLRKEYIRVISEIIFIKKSNIAHKGKYDYSKVYYVNARKKVIIICPIHGEFEQTPDKHLKCRACPKCGNENSSKKRRKKSEQFEKQANEIHNYKYIYFGDYVNSHAKVKIWCKIHKEIFWQTPHNHLQGSGCPKCGQENTIKSKIKSLEHFIKEANELHNGKYDYSEVDYINAHAKVKIWCKIHKEIFWQTPHNHLQGKGCPKCKQSKGETQIENYLKENIIKYETQKKFDECKHKLPLPFDFYLPDYDLLIEFQGIQHYEKFRFEKNDDKLKQRQKNDQIKKDFCLKPENPNLLEIKYTEINNINEILKEKIS